MSWTTPEPCQHGTARGGITTSLQQAPGRPLRKGETALRVYAPLRSKRRELDPDTGEIQEPSIVGFKLVPVFHQGQLVAPPDLPAQPKLLDGQDPPPEIWNAIAEQIYAAGYTLQRGPLDGPAGAKGVTSFIERTVTVRDDLAPAQALKTQIHELGHVLMHEAEAREPGMTRDRIEVEAESVAYVVCDLVGIHAGSYSIPYGANWAGVDVELVEATAQKMLTTARQIVKGLEAELGVDIRPNPIAAVLDNEVRPQDPEPSANRTPVGVGTTDEIIDAHLTNGGLDWEHLVASIPAIETHRAGDFVDDPAAQAIVLADAGASADATASVLRAHGLDDDTIVSLLTVTVPDPLGARSTLYDRDEAVLRESAGHQAASDELVADLSSRPADTRLERATSQSPAASPRPSST